LIKRGTFIGIYSGELVTEAETEVRGRIYEKVGRTYLFDLDGYHISHPPQGLEAIDPRAYELAMTVKDRAQKFKQKELMDQGIISHPSEADDVNDDDCDFTYSAYSGESQGPTKHI
jgi:histone-lysine N-methyltransferase SUV39H